MSELRRPYEIDTRTLKLIVGVIAILLPILAWRLSEAPIDSISESYHQGEWPRNIFVGFLFAIGAFLLAYNGKSRREMVLSKVAAFAAAGIAMFPCKCGVYDEVIAGVHGISAAVMFLVLAYFCYRFYERARDKARTRASVRANVRAGIYAVCGVAIVGSIAVLGADKLLLECALSNRFEALTFWGEAAGLVAFGVSWLTASHVLPLINEPSERFSLIREHNPPA